MKEIKKVCILGDDLGFRLAVRLARKGLKIELANKCKFPKEVEGPCRTEGINIIDYCDMTCQGDLIIECFRENRDEKRQVLIDVSNKVLDTPIIINSSTISTSSLLEGLEIHSNICRIYFSDFAPNGFLAEVAEPEKNWDFQERIISWLKGMNIETIMTKDFPGVNISRPWLVYINDCINAVHLNASLEDIGGVARGKQLGGISALQSADYLGLDNCLLMLQNLFDFYGKQRFFPSPLLKQKVFIKKLGRKTKEGFFNYHQESAWGYELL